MGKEDCRKIPYRGSEEMLNTKKEFRKSIRCGTGKAYFILKDNPKVDFSRDIIKAATFNFAYDGRAEGDRAHYLSQLINLSGKKDKIVASHLNALAKERDNCWTLNQLFELAAIFAKEGNQKASKAIYARFHKKTIEYAEWVGDDAILSIDGFAGLKRIAVERGKALMNNPEDDQGDSYLVDDFQDKHPELKVYDELKKASKSNPYIKKYWSKILADKKTILTIPQKPRYTYQIVKNNIDRDTARHFVLFGVKQLKERDIKRLAQDFLKETDPIKQERYLRIFSRRKFPFDYHQILELAKSRYSRKNRLVEFACEALQYFKADDIREFAIRKLKITNNPADYLYLLVSNYMKGDWKLLTKIAERHKKDDVLHSMVWAYIAIYKRNKTLECRKPLEVLYEKLTCGIHRCDIVEILYNNGALSKRILKEIEYDSYESTRELHHKIMAEPPPRIQGTQ